MDTYLNKTCPYCKTELNSTDEVIECSKCGMPHHKNCWEENLGCTTFGCTGKLQQVSANGEEIICYSCGYSNTGGAKFCANCGISLSINNNHNQAYNQPHQSHQSQQDYQANQSQQSNYGSSSYYTQANSINDDFTMFIGNNASYYISKFSDIKNSTNKNSWNWPAFLFSSYWLIYRKMYTPGLILAGVGFFMSVFPIAGIIGLGVSIYLGVMGNSIYLNYVEKEISNARNLNSINKQQLFNKRGGTSIGPVFGVMAVIFILALLSY
ncbi:DUF2628 domain-containing protein [Tissierella creatinini]|nr:DUF2628 domain-containing protein [Tissierella creatinini]TJX61013.1 DUF2628 domain-containing protein [Soehngenia saccharolytica]